MAHKNYPVNMSIGISVLNLEAYADSHESHLAALSGARSIWGTSLARFLRILALPRNRLLLLTIALCAILTMGCTTVIAFSRAYPASDRLSELGLRRCIETLCFRGIIPGRTSWQDAIVAFNGHSIAEGDPFFGRIMLLPSSDGNSLESILIDHPLDEPIQLGEIMALYSFPACVDIYPRTGMLVLHYGMLHVLTRFINTQISPNTPVMQIVLKIPVPNSNTSPQCSSVHSAEINGQYAQRSWRGFVSEQRYLSENK